jgi:uncharacterized protein (DUF1501 family)
MLHAAAAEAGKGLPQIETGMPEPAGTGLTRRSLILRGAGLALAVYGSKLALPALDQGIAAAAPPDRVLVSIFLDGGLDVMSLLAPTGDPRYRKLRPNLALKASETIPFAEDPRLRWHPSAANLARLHREGKVTVFPAMGYGGPDQSHFTSRHFYEIGETEVGARTGWLGRYLDLAGTADNPMQGLSLERALSPTLATASNPVAALGSVGGYQLGSPAGEPVKSEIFTSFERMGALPANSAGLRQLRDATTQTARLRRDLPALETTGDRGYPESPMAARLKMLAGYLDLGLPIRVATLTGSGGYDTHAGQAPTLKGNIRATSDAIFAFQRDLELRGLADRVLVHVWSEFGRRPAENGSAGTDHGAAGVGLVIGSLASGTMAGEFPGLKRLDRLGNLRHTSDFRGLYCGLLEQWFGQDPAAIIPGAARFARPKVVK